MGVPGLLLWLALIFGGIGAMINLRRRLGKQWARGDPEQRFLYYAALYFPISLIGFSVTSAFVSFAYIDPLYLMAAYMTGLYSSVRVKVGQGLPVAPPVRGRAAAQTMRMRPARSR